MYEYEALFENLIEFINETNIPNQYIISRLISNLIEEEYINRTLLIDLKKYINKTMNQKEFY